MFLNTQTPAKNIAQVIKKSLPAVGALALTITMAPGALAAKLADFIFIVDESGSMSGEHYWLGSMIGSLDKGLIDQGVTARYGLVGYGTPNHGVGSSQDPYMHTVGGGQFGNAAEFATATQGLIASGGIEDGYEAIMYALNNYQTQAGAVLNVVLVTDEDRDVTTNDTYNDVLGALTGKNALLNVVVNNPFGSSSANTGAVGVDGTNSFFADGAGGFNTVAGSFVGDGFGNTENDYLPMAFATGGAGWDLNKLRAGGSTADSFTAAFVDVKVKETVGTVPEPLTMLGAGAALGFGGFFKRELSKKKNKKDNA